MSYIDTPAIAAASLQRYLKYKTYELLHNDWYGIITLRRPGGYEVNTHCAHFNECTEKNSLIYSFIEENSAALLADQQPYVEYRYKDATFVMYPIRDATDLRVIALYVFFDLEPDPLSLSWVRNLLSVSYSSISLSEELVRNRDFLSNILNHIPFAVFVFDHSYRLTTFNTNAQKLLFSSVAPTLNDLMVSNTDDFKQLIDQCFATDTPIRQPEFIVYQGTTQRIFNVSFVPLHNSGNSCTPIYGVLLIANDTTSDNIAGFESAQNRQYDLLSEISVGLAHDIKNPLTNIRNCATLIKKKYDSPNIGSTEYLDMIIEETERINNVVDQMMSFGVAAHTPTYIPVNVNRLLNDCTNSILRQKGLRAIHVEQDFDRSLPLIIGQVLDFQQIFTNVLVNAMQAITDSGTITVHTSYLKDTEEILVRISDNGCGMSAEKIEHMFTPYYTTKDSGTGLGLFVTRSILNRYSGRIEIASTECVGTVVSIYLPVNPSSVSEQ